MFGYRPAMKVEISFKSFFNLSLLEQCVNNMAILNIKLFFCIVDYFATKNSHCKHPPPKTKGGFPSQNFTFPALNKLAGSLPQESKGMSLDAHSPYLVSSTVFFWG